MEQAGGEGAGPAGGAAVREEAAVRATYKRPNPSCSECGRKGEPGGVRVVRGAHWHGTHPLEDCRAKIERQGEADIHRALEETGGRYLPHNLQANFSEGL